MKRSDFLILHLYLVYFYYLMIKSEFVEINNKFLTNPEECNTCKSFLNVYFIIINSQEYLMVTFPDYEKHYNDKINSNIFPSLDSNYTQQMDYSMLSRDHNISQTNKIDEYEDMNSSEKDISNLTNNENNQEDEMSSDNDNTYTKSNNEEETIFDEVQFYFFSNYYNQSELIAPIPKWEITDKPLQPLSHSYDIENDPLIQNTKLVLNEEWIKNIELLRYRKKKSI